MSSYYEYRFNTLNDAMEFCQAFAQLRDGLVFRGQCNAAWELRANVFRGNGTTEQIRERFSRTQAFMGWCRDNPRLPRYTNDQLLQIAQHYGMPTDLLDFTTDIWVAAFFALECDRETGRFMADRAALYVIDPEDIARIGALEIPDGQLQDLARRYQNMYHRGDLLGLSRLAAQSGVFVRDPHGTLEGITDGMFSYVPLFFEEQYGHSICLHKASFVPRPCDVELVHGRGYTPDRVYPPPNDLEREIGKFQDLLQEQEFHGWLNALGDVATVTVSRKRREQNLSPQEAWHSQQYATWKDLNLTTQDFRIGGPSQREKITVPTDLLFGDAGITIVSDCVHRALSAGTPPLLVFEFQDGGTSGRFVCPEPMPSLLQVLHRLPYPGACLSKCLLNSLRLAVVCRHVPLSELPQEELLAKAFSPFSQFHYLDFITFSEEHVVKAFVPLDALSQYRSVQECCSRELRTRPTEMSTEEGPRYQQLLYRLLFNRPSFRALLAPEDAIDLWASYLIPWQVCRRRWVSAVLNPFQVEHLGLS